MVLITLSNVWLFFNYLISNFASFAHYERYGEEVKSSGSGLFNYFLFAFFLLYVIQVVKGKFVKNVANSTLSFYIFGFIFSMLGYIMGIARLNYYTITFTAVAVPTYFFLSDIRCVKANFIVNYKNQKRLWFLYLIYQGTSSLIKYTNPLSTSSIDSYELFNPFMNL